MDERQFWIALWRAVGAVVVGVTLIIGGCTAYRSTLIERAVSAGVDPAKARCAIAGADGVGDTAICMAASK